MNNLFKTPIFIKKSINGPKKLGRSSHNSFFVGLVVLFSLLKIVFSKVRAALFYTASHYPSYSSGMSISSFRYSPASLESTGLLNYRIKTTESNKLPVITESFNIHKLCHKINSRLFSNARNRREDLYFSFKKFFCLLCDKFTYILFLFEKPI